MAEKDTPKLAGDVIGEVKLGGVRLELRRSVHNTVSQFHDTHGTRRLTPAQIRTAYRALTGDHRDEIDLRKAQAVLLGHLQVEWYKNAGTPIPAYCVNSQEQRLKEARESKQVTTPATETRKDRPTVGKLIRSALGRNFSDEVILDHIKKDFPKSKATVKDIAYYRSKMRNEGLLPKFVRPAKPGKKTRPAKKAGKKKAGAAAK